MDDIKKTLNELNQLQSKNKSNEQQLMKQSLEKEIKSLEK